MSDSGTTPKSRSDSMEFDARFQKRFWKIIVVVLSIGTMAGTPMYCISQLPTEAKVKEMAPSRVEFARAVGRIEAIEKGNHQFEKRVDRRFEEVKAGLRELSTKMDTLRRARE